MVVKLKCRKSNVIVSGVTGITRAEEKQVLFFMKLLAKLHEVSFK